MSNSTRKTKSLPFERISRLMTLAHVRRTCPGPAFVPAVRKRSQQARSILLHTHQKIRGEERDQPGQSRKHCFRLVPQSKDKEWE
jgi:hypothetical protein